MAGPPIGLGYCDTCKYYDRELSWCRVLPPAVHAAGPGGWPSTLPTHWCGRWESPMALPMEIVVAPASVPRMTGTVTVSVYSGGAGMFLSEDVVRCNNVNQPTTFVSSNHLTFPLDTAQAAGDYPVRVTRPSTGHQSNVAVVKLT